MSHRNYAAAPKRHLLRKTVLWIAGILAVLFLVLQFALGTIVRKAAVAAAPAFLGTEVTIENIHARIFSGIVSVDGMVVGPPEGFDANVFELSKFNFDLDMASLLQSSKPIHIREIRIENPKVAYEVKGLGNTNIKAILDKLGAAEEAEKEDGGKGRKVVIDRFLFKGGEVKVAVWDGKGGGVSLPDIELTDIGGKSGGATGLEATGQILRQISFGTVKAAASLVGDVAGTAVNAVKGVGGAAMDAVKAIGSVFGGGDETPPPAEE